MNDIRIRAVDTLNEYEKNNPMSHDERNALYEWLLDGNSVYDNPYLCMDSSGVPMEFLFAYRMEEEINKKLEVLSERERVNYIARIRGEDTIDNLKEDLYQAVFRLRICEQVLASYGLLDKVEERMKESEALSIALDEEFKKSKINEELPFSTGGE